MVNGMVVGLVLVFIICFDVNILVVMVEVLFVLFCEVMQGKLEFVDFLMYKLKYYLGQMEVVVIMEYFFDGSFYMKVVVKLYEMDLLKKFKQDWYVLCILLQWLGFQVEVICNVMYFIQWEINFVNDNFFIDVVGDRVFYGGNF